MPHAPDALTISSEPRLEKENQDLKSVQVQKIERIKEESDRKAIDHNNVMMEAIKDALDAKSKASLMTMEDAWGWK